MGNHRFFVDSVEGNEVEMLSRMALRRKSPSLRARGGKIGRGQVCFKSRKGEKKMAERENTFLRGPKYGEQRRDSLFDFRVPSWLQGETEAWCRRQT